MSEILDRTNQSYDLLPAANAFFIFFSPFLLKGTKDIPAFLFFCINNLIPLVIVNRKILNYNSFYLPSQHIPYAGQIFLNYFL